MGCRAERLIPFVSQLSWLELTCRIRQAQALLGPGDVSPEEVAQGTGFAEAVHAGRRFRQIVGHRTCHMAAHAALPATAQSADAAPGVAGALPFQRRSPFGGVWNRGEAVLLILGMERLVLGQKANLRGGICDYSFKER